MCRASYTLPLDDGKPDTRWFVSRIVANAIDLAQGWEPGPVHINVPLREPLYTPPPAQAAQPAATGLLAVPPRTLPSQRLAETPGRICSNSGTPHRASSSLGACIQPTLASMPH